MYLIVLPWLMTRPAAACEAVSMMAQLEPAAAGWEDSERASDGEIAPIGEASTTTMSARAVDGGAELVWHFEASRNLKALVLEIEADDQVELKVLDPGGDWNSLGRVGPRDGGGLDVYEGHFNLSITGLKLVGVAGAPFAVAEVAAYDCLEPWPARDLRVRTGRQDLPPRETWQYLGVGHAWVAVWASVALTLARRERWRFAGASAALLAAGVVWPLVGLVGAALGAIVAGWAVLRARRSAVLCAMIVLSSALAWSNFGGFRQIGTPVHYHEFFHYYLGARYAESLGYGRLYACTAAAEADLYPEQVTQLEARPIRRAEDGLVVSGKEVLKRAQECHDRFGADWDAFRGEVAVFRSIFSPQSWRNIFLDHEYNASPVWSLVAGPLTHGAPITRAQDLYPLVWIDPLLGAVIVGILVWTWGWEAAAWAGLVWALGWPWRYGFIGGSFARLEWPLLLACASAFAARHRPTLAGVLVGLAASVRVFPALVLVGPALLWCIQPVFRGAVCRVFLGAAAGGLVTFAVSLTVFQVDIWHEFLINLSSHSAIDSNNKMGLENLVPDNTPMGVGRLLVGLLMLIWLAGEARKTTSVSTLLLQALLIPLFVLNLSSYYWLGLALLGPLWAARPARAAALVAALAGHDLLVNYLPMSPQLPYGIAYALFAPLAVWAASSTHPPLRDKDAPLSGHALSAPRGSPS